MWGFSFQIAILLRAIKTSESQVVYSPWRQKFWGSSSFTPSQAPFFPRRRKGRGPVAAIACDVQWPPAFFVCEDCSLLRTRSSPCPFLSIRVVLLLWWPPLSLVGVRPTNWSLFTPLRSILNFLWNLTPMMGYFSVHIYVLMILKPKILSLFLFWILYKRMFLKI